MLFWARWILISCTAPCDDGRTAIGPWPAKSDLEIIGAYIICITMALESWGVISKWFQGKVEICKRM
jgi:hypothetical protein